MIIAIDGPAASGKGTLARRLAGHFGFSHLDTGKLYRAVGLAVLRDGGDPDDNADRWTGQGDSGRGAGSIGFPFQFGHAPKGEQGDPTDTNVVVFRYQ